MPWEMLKVGVAVGLCGIIPAMWPAAAQVTPQVATTDMAAAQETPFRDPKTNQRWTPDNVGEGGKPIDPSDRAFDPAAQAATMEGALIVIPRVHHVGKVPITAGPTVPLAEIDNLALKPDTVAGRWQVVFYLQNNSAVALAAVVTCRFQNGAKPVAQAIVFPPPPGPGDRLGIFFHGPPTAVYVDKVDCRLASP
jgi:hypothetical protein